MIQIDFDPAKIADASRRAEWEALVSLANAATEKVITEWETWKLNRIQWKKNPVGPPPDFKPAWDEDVWRALRTWLLENVFHNKCAYCESEVTGFSGNAEHFRPKGRVRVVTEQGSAEIVKIVDEDNEEIPHPGYFWLAYHWQNILPACSWCNGYKQDKFPVGKSHVAVKRLTVEEIDKLFYRITKSIKDDNVFYLEPGDLDVHEGRLLLHPYYDNPEEHLCFKPDGTAAVWRASKQGEASIGVFDLNHKGKVAARQKEQHRGLKEFHTRLAAMREGEDVINWARRVAQELRDEYYGGGQRYAVAVFDFIHHVLGGSAVDPDRLLGERRKTS